MTPDYQADLVSVIVPTFNRAHYLLDCLNSVVRQTYRPIELIVVDDGSTDDTQAVVARWREALTLDREFSIVFSTLPNGGANIARNHGLLASKGEFIQFLDSDDLLLPHKLTNAVRSIREQDADYAYCPVAFCDEKLQPRPGSFGAALTGNDSDYLTYLWQTMGPVYRRNVIQTVGPWLESIFYADDWEYAARVKLQGWKGVFDPTVGAKLRCYPRADRKARAQQLAEARDYFLAHERIANLATQIGRATPSVRLRLFRRFLVCGLQFGRCGDFERQREAFARAHSLAGSGVTMRLMTGVLSTIRIAALHRVSLWLVRSTF